LGLPSFSYAIARRRRTVMDGGQFDRIAVRWATAARGSVLTVLVQALAGPAVG